MTEGANMLIILNLYVVGVLAALAVILWAAKEADFTPETDAVFFSVMMWPVFFWLLFRKYFRNRAARKDVD
jgi:hypothetical protein